MHQVLGNSDLFHTHAASIGQGQVSDYYTESKLYCILADFLAEYQEMQ
jgi:hypothetical protein